APGTRLHQQQTLKARFNQAGGWSTGLKWIALSALVGFLYFMIPGALPQARHECRAFGAKHMPSHRDSHNFLSRQCTLSSRAWIGPAGVRWLESRWNASTRIIPASRSAFEFRNFLSDCAETSRHLAMVMCGCVGRRSCSSPAASADSWTRLWI